MNRTSLRRLALVVAAVGLLAMPVILDAVTVTPAALYITNRTRSGSLTLINADRVTKEVEIGFAFGYPQLDSGGRLVVPLLTVAPDSEPSAMAWLSAFPRRVRLEPGQRQVVRVMAQPPAGLPQGEYWARVLVRSREAQQRVEVQPEDSVRLRVGLETVLATAVSYRNGPVTTGLDVASGRASFADSVVKFSLDLKRTGNAAYLGNMKAEVVDARGATIGVLNEDLAVYRSMPREFQVRVTRMPASWTGATVRFRITTERPDLPADGPLPAPARSGSLPIES